MPVDTSEASNKAKIEQAVDDYDASEAGQFAILLSYTCTKVDDVEEAIKLATEGMKASTVDIE